MPHEQVAATIRGAGIELLFDLRGWGGGGVPEVLAMRPAPLQVNWLAYPGTSGAPWIDHVLADAFVLPRIAGAAFQRNRAAPAALLPAFGYHARHRPAAIARGTTACRRKASSTAASTTATNSIRAASPARCRCWRGSTAACCGCCPGPGRSDDRLRDAARDAGVDPARLVFMAQAAAAEYLGRLQRADLFLDTNPYNAHTTASDALWAGCPVLTQPGDDVRRARRRQPQPPSRPRRDECRRRCGASSSSRWRWDATRPGCGHCANACASAKATSGLFDMPGFAADFAAMAKRLVDRHHRAGLPRPRWPIRPMGCARLAP